jgi:hypothetical protein
MIRHSRIFPVLIGSLAILAGGCAVDKGVEPESAVFQFNFKPGKGDFVTRIDDDSVVWNLTRAGACIGEIGIHWGRTPGLGKVAHDEPGGKISPKIYSYYAIDFLAEDSLSTLKVEPNNYNHVHMIFRKASGDSVIGLDRLEPLTGHTVFFEGTVSNGAETRPFRAQFDSTYKENELGDVIFQLRVQKDESFLLSLSPRLPTWFNDVLWGDLTPTHGDTVVITRTNENHAAADKIEKRFSMDNAFDFQVEQK